MKTYLPVAALVALFAQPAAAVTFPSLTTIYVGSGVTDNGGAENAGIATTFLCSNVSGVDASVRWLVLDASGTIVEGQSTFPVGHGETLAVSTHFTATFTTATLNTGIVNHGVVNIESTQSAVFCTAAIVDAAGPPPAFTMPLHLVRVNPHPGTVE